MKNYIFFAWLELPYFVGVHYDAIYPVTYKTGVLVDLHIRFRSDLLKVATSNQWANSEYRQQQIQLMIKEPDSELVYVPRYITKDRLDEIAELVEKYSLPYLHVEHTETVVELEGELQITGEDESLRSQLGINVNFLPSTMFFTEQVLPKISDAVDAYRVATLPSVRYSIHPISEGVVNSAFIEIRDNTGNIVQQIYHGIDIHGHNRYMQPHIERLDIQSRFDVALNQPQTCAFEIQFCSAYYLYHMRRWTEAVTLASGVVDQLIKRAVFSKLNSAIADVVWTAYRIRFEELFNKILPGLGLPKLAESDQRLWKEFKEAKNYRGSRAHGSVGGSFNSDDEKRVKEHLIAFYNVSRWLSLQDGRPWALDVTDEGNLLPFF